MANLDQVPLNTGTVQALTYLAPFGPLTQQTLTYDLSAAVTDACWEPVTQRLLAYFARPFNNFTKYNRLHRLLSAVARELSACIEAVALTNSTDVRGDGTFTVYTRFEPITAVASVQRVDGSGNVLETYTVTGFDGNKITLSGSKAPGRGDNLQATYSYLHKGLAYRINEALLELNILTATGAFLDAWGRWFAVPRQVIRKYGSAKYSAIKYGTQGLESDTQYSRRVIDRITQNRNSKNAIIAAVQRVTGGTVYIVEWVDQRVDQGWVFKTAGSADWAGEADTSKHLIWGRTSRFIDGSASGGGVCVFEVWIPRSSTYSTYQILEIVNQYKPAGTRAFIRYQ